MPSKKLKVGLTAGFDTNQTPHGRTFLRAIAMAINEIPSVAKLELVFADDGASRLRAVDVALSFVKQGIDLVVGHFASDAALTARDIYAQHKIPLLLPAATASVLTKNKTNLFRMCPSDTLLANRLIRYVQHKGWTMISVEADASVHGSMLADEIRAQARQAKLSLLEDLPSVEASVFAGRVGASADYVTTRRAGGYDGPIILTDDAASPYLLASIKNPGDLIVVSFPPASMIDEAFDITAAHRASFGDEPGVYFLESIAALSIAAQLSAKGGELLQSLQTGSFPTAAGPISFNEGERINPPHAIWSSQGKCLEATQLICD